MNQDTICAIATAQGGAIGSIRVSGPEAITITGRIFTPAKSGKLLSEQKPYTLTFGRIYNGEEMIDEALIQGKTALKSPVTDHLIFYNK